MPSGFDFGLLDRVSLKEVVEVDLVTPRSVVVVKLYRAGDGLADHRVDPAGKFDSPTFCPVGEDLVRSKFRVLEVEPTTGRLHSNRITDFGLDLNDVTHDLLLLLCDGSERWLGLVIRVIGWFGKGCF